MKHYSLVIEERLVGEIDKLVSEIGLYSSRSDFIRDAIRARLIEVKRTLAELKEEVEAAADSHEDEARAELGHELHEHAWKGVH